MYPVCGTTKTTVLHFLQDYVPLPQPSQTQQLGFVLHPSSQPLHFFLASALQTLTTRLILLLHLVILPNTTQPGKL